MLQDLEFVKEINNKQLTQAVEIFYEAFERKIHCFMRPRDKAIEAHVAALRKTGSLFVIYEKKVIGFAGLHYGSSNFMNFKFNELRKTFNFLKSCFYCLIFKITTTKIKLIGDHCLILN